jgi:hypothetical protein
MRRPRAALQSLWPWIEQASKRLHRNVLTIALANKLARIAWAVLARGHAYQPKVAADAVLQERAQVHQRDGRHPLCAPSLASGRWGERAMVAPRGWLHMTL